MAYNINQERLTKTLAEAYDIDFPQVIYDRAINVTSELDPNALAAAKLGAEGSGKSKRATDTSTGAPLVNIKLSSEPLPIFREQTAYNIDATDVIYTANGDYSTISKKMRTCMRVFEEKLDETALSGVGDYKGILTTALANANRIAAGGTFASLDASAIHEKLTEAFGLVYSRSGGRQIANTLILPLSSFTVLSQKVFAAAPGISLLEALQNAGQALMREASRNGRGGEGDEFRILGTHRSATAGRCYDRSPEFMQMELVRNLEFDDPYTDSNGDVYIGNFAFTPAQINATNGMVEISGVA